MRRSRPFLICAFGALGALALSGCGDLGAKSQGEGELAGEGEGEAGGEGEGETGGEGEGEGETGGEGEGEGETGGEGEGEGPLGATLEIDDADEWITVDYNWVFSIEGSGTGFSADDFEGEVAYYYYHETNGKVRQSCDLDIALTGSAFVGDCDDCDYAWDIDAEIVSDDSLVACTPNPFYSYIPHGTFANPGILYWDAREDYWGRYDYEVLATSYAYDLTAYGGGYYPGPYFQIIASDSSYDGTAERDGTDFTWSTYAASSGIYATINYWSYYVGYEGLGYAPPYTTGINYGGFAYAGELNKLDASSYGMDGWELELSAGDTFYVSVDNAEEDAACNLAAFINGPAGNTLLFENDNFVCTYAPGTPYYCPSGYIVAPYDGTYTVWVLALGSRACTGRPGQYLMYLDKR